VEEQGLRGHGPRRRRDGLLRQRASWRDVEQLPVMPCRRRPRQLMIGDLHLHVVGRALRRGSMACVRRVIRRLRVCGAQLPQLGACVLRRRLRYLFGVSSAV
jgi:hypothetical protein